MFIQKIHLLTGILSNAKIVLSNMTADMQINCLCWPNCNSNIYVFPNLDVTGIELNINVACYRFCQLLIVTVGNRRDLFAIPEMYQHKASKCLKLGRCLCEPCLQARLKLIYAALYLP